MKNVSLESVPPYFFKSKFLRLDQAVSSSTFRLWPFAVSITVLQYQIPLFRRFDYRFLFALDPQGSDDRKSLCEGMFGRSASLNRRNFCLSIQFVTTVANLNLNDSISMNSI